MTISGRAKLLRFGLRTALGHRASPNATIEGARNRIRVLARFIPRPPRGVEIAEIDTGGVAAERITSELSRPDRHVLYLHGGAYVLGWPSLYRDLTWRIAAAARATVLCIDYRLAPEHPFPAALDDAMTGYRWLLAQGADPRHVAISGDSAGGGLMLALMLRLRDEALPLPAAGATVSPWTDLALTGPSFRPGRSAADPMIQTGAASRVAGLYLAGADPRNPYASPLYGDPTGLPPVLIMVGSDEVLRDDAVRMADRMRAAGCDVVLDVTPGMFHGWHLFSRLMPESRRTVARIGAFLQSRLG